MRNPLFLLIALLTLVSCDLERTENHDIMLRVGETFHLDRTNYKMNLPPDDFVALLERGRVMAMHAGYTEMEITTGHTTHFYQIYVEPRTTLYNDMKFLLGQSKEAIVSQFGPSVDKEHDWYLFRPKTSRLPEKYYSFKFNRFNRAEACCIGFDPGYDRDIRDHLVERYEKLGESRNMITYGDYYRFDQCDLYVFYKLDANPRQILYYTREYYDGLIRPID